MIALKIRKRSDRFSISLLLGERQKLRSVSKRGQFNVPRVTNADGGWRAYMARKTGYWWFNNLRVDHARAS
jgi:hypothetical protein